MIDFIVPESVSLKPCNDASNAGPMNKNCKIKIVIFSHKSHSRIAIVRLSVWNQNPSATQNHQLTSNINELLPLIFSTLAQARPFTTF